MFAKLIAFSLVAISLLGCGRQPLHLTEPSTASSALLWRGPGATPRPTEPPKPTPTPSPLPSSPPAGTPPPSPTSPPMPTTTPPAPTVTPLPSPSPPVPFHLLAPKEVVYPRKLLYQRLNYFFEAPYPATSGGVRGETFYYSKDTAGNITTTAIIHAGMDRYTESRTFAWDANRRLTKVVYGPNSALRESHNYYYDSIGRVIRETIVNTLTSRVTHRNYEFLNEGSLIVESVSDANGYVYCRTESDFLTRTSTTYSTRRYACDDTAPVGAPLIFRAQKRFAFMAYTPPLPDLPEILRDRDRSLDRFFQTGVVRFGQIGPIEFFGPSGEHEEVEGGNCRALDTSTLQCSTPQYFSSGIPYDHTETYQIVRETMEGRSWYRYATIREHAVRPDDWLPSTGEYILNPLLRVLSSTHSDGYAFQRQYDSSGLFPLRKKAIYRGQLAEDETITYYPN